MNFEYVAVEDKDGEISNGLAKSGTKEGDKVTINLCDENGKEIQVTGIVTEILKILLPPEAPTSRLIAAFWVKKLIKGE